MSKYRKFLVSFLALIATVLVSCSSPPPVAQVTTYTGEQIAQIQEYVDKISEVRDRLPELQKLIQTEDWIYIRNFIHGPVGDLRVDMVNLTRNLLPKAQPQAQALAKDVFDHLVDIDQAAQTKNYKVAVRNYAQVVKDLDSFFQLIPQG